MKPCLKMSFKYLTKVKLKHLFAILCTIFLLDFFGAFTHYFEISFDENFSYPYEGDVHDFILAMRHNEKPKVSPINVYNYSFIHKSYGKCKDPNHKMLRVIFFVKSAAEHFHRRLAIRHSWGFENRFSDVPFKTIFVLGDHPNDDELRTKINVEAVKFQDIIQADFIDSYYNNTIKTMMTFKWAVNNCKNSKFYMFVDDDIYVSVKNVLRFIRNPALYPDYLKDAVKFKDLKHLKSRYKRATAKEKVEMRRKSGWSNHNKSTFHHLIENKTDSELLRNISTTKEMIRNKRDILDIELPDDVRLFAGYVIISAPHRHKTSKWYVPLNEYPYHLWPPYITAGAYILSKEALLDMYFASMYTRHFRFDDIFLGLTARKADIEPFHCEEFHFYKKEYTKYNYKYVITSHGFEDPDELLRVWNEQKALGNA